MITSHILGHVKVAAGTQDQLAGEVLAAIDARRRIGCIPLNVTKYVMAKSDAKLRGALGDCALVIADGMPIVWLARRLGYRDVHRITGVGFAEHLMAEAAQRGLGVYFLGSRQENLDAALAAIRTRYPDISIVGSRNGYFAADQAAEVVAGINAARPDILFLGLGLPQKEYFLADHQAAMNVGFCITVGGAIDIWSGAKQRAPALFQKLGLEWLYRSIYDLSRGRLIVRFGLHFLRDIVSMPSRG